MDEMNEKDLARIRIRFIDLVKSFFFSEPDAEKLSRWRGIFSSLDGERVNLQFDAAVVECSAHLAKKSLADLEAEFYTLFVDPFAEGHIARNASFYIDGRHHGKTLAEFRGLLAEAEIVKEEDVTDPEDTLVIVLDSLLRLIEMELDGKECARAFQTKLITEYLEPLATNISLALKNHPEADFYTSCSKFLRGYLDLERGLIMEI